MPKKSVRRFTGPTRRSARIKRGYTAAGRNPVIDLARADAEPMMSTSEDESPELELILADGIQKDESESVSRNNSIPESEKKGEKHSKSASGTPSADRHPLTRTMGKASFVHQDCPKDEQGVEREGPVLILRKSDIDPLQNNLRGIVNLEPPTISEMLMPRDIEKPNPFEQRPIDLMNQDKNGYLRRSASRDWSWGSPDPDISHNLDQSEEDEIPSKRTRGNEEEFEMVASRNHPSCSYSVQYTTFDDDSSSSFLSSDNNLPARKIKTRTVCKSCGGHGHRNILDDHLKGVITKQLAKYGLNNHSRFPN